MMEIEMENAIRDLQKRLFVLEKKDSLFSAPTPSTTGVMTVEMINDIITCTPTGDMTLNAIHGRIGQIVTFHFTTSGTSSYTITFGTNFRKTGTLATGTTSARFFSITFRCIDGTIWSEIARTAVQT